MRIDWWTLALQAINFLALCWLLWRFLYRPVEDVIAKRKALADAAFAEAAEKQKVADDERAKLEAERAELSEERKALLKKLHEEVEGERRQTRAAAKQEAAQLIEKARAQISKERAAALKDLRAQAAALAAEMAASLLRNLGSEALYDPVLAKLCDALQGLDERERARLLKDLDEAGARIEAVTSAPLSKDAQTRWRARIGQILPAEEKLNFVADDSLLGGAELRFPHAVLDFSWAAQLKQAQDAMSENDDAA